MHRPWQIWSTFAACLLAVMLAVGWLSFRALESDRRDAKAQQQAVVEENARLALWRMDSSMATLVAQESARPYFVYRSFLPADQQQGKSEPAKGGMGGGMTCVPSPLLAQSHPLVSLYFQINADGMTFSPQCPTGEDCKLAVPQWLSAEQLLDNGKALSQVEMKVDRTKLLAELPPLEPGVPQTDFFGQNVSLPVSNAASSRLSPPALQTDSPPGSPFPEQIAAVPPQNSPPNQRSQKSANAPPRQRVDINAPNDDDPFQDQTVQQAFSPQSQLARSQAEYQSRSKLVQGNTANLNYSANNDFANRLQERQVEVRMSMMKPFWIEGDLLLARRVAVGDRELIQAAVLDWPAIKQQLLSEISDLLPEAELLPVATGDDSGDVRRLASLPVKLVPGTLSKLAIGGITPVQMSLLVAWIALILAALAAAVLLRGILALSERRATFVSAVTHELRTPLTTFRMYAEMLSEGMVRSETDRRGYLETLRREAERLTHLVANVLAYARLERGSAGSRAEVVSVERLLEIATQRLADRAGQCDFQLHVSAEPEVLKCSVKCDPSAVEQILFNLVDNACKYAANGKAAAGANRRELLLVVSQPAPSASRPVVELRLSDHGPGISREERKRIFQPFRKSAQDAAHSAPGVGLGLSLSRRLARDMKGELGYEPRPEGACFVLSLPSAS